jgi:hypothetical protein
MNRTAALTPLCLAIGTMSVISSGCLDDPFGTSSQDGSSVLYINSLRERVRGFELDLNALGSFKPGEPFTVSVKISSHVHMPDVTVRLTALDIPFAEGANPTGFVSLRNWRGGVSTTPQNILTEQFAFSEPGYYRIVVSAALTAPPTIATSSPEDLPQATTHTLWLLVDPQGGRLTDGYIEQPQDSLRLLFGAYGPYRQPLKRSTLARSDAPHAAASADPYYLYGYYKYFDESTQSGYYVNAYVTAAGGYVNATCVGFSSSEVLIPDVEETVISWVEADGEFSVWCPTEAAYAWDHIEGMVYPRDVGVVDVRNSSGSANGSSFYGWNEDTVTVYAASNRQGHVLTVLAQRVPTANDAFDRYRSEIEARVWDSGSEGGGYVLTADRIDYKRSTTMFNDDGPWYFMHEYGHAFHWEAIEEPDTTGGGICPGHEPPDSTNLSCALIEGFADMFATYLLADFMTSSDYTHDYNMEINVFNDDGDGSIIEGAVAGFVYDLVDDEDTPDSLSGDDDDAAYSLAAIGNILATCDMPGKSKIDGIDRFVYCAEETLAMQDSINPATSDYWFASRRPTTFSSFSVTSQGMNLSIVRRTWKYNLFNQGSLK